MRVGIDANPLLTGHMTRGIGRYVYDLVRAMVGCSAGYGIEICLLFNQANPADLPAWGLRHVAAPAGTLSAVVTAEGLSVLHLTDCNYPLSRPEDLDAVRAGGCKVAMTVYDLVPVMYRELYGSGNVLDVNVQPSLDRIDRFIAISRWTAGTMETLWSIESGRISVIYPGVDVHLFHRGHQGSAAAETCRRLGLPNPYVLFVGSCNDWRKNFGGLLKAFDLMSRSLPGYDLVAVGHDRPGVPLEQLQSSLGLQGRVRYVGFVNNADLARLYAGAAVFALPSLVEGFGLPYLEAMACGTPVLAGNASAIPEVVGDAGLCVDASDPAQIAAGLVQLATDQGVREALIRKGSERVYRFLIGHTAERTLQLYRQMAGR